MSLKEKRNKNDKTIKKDATVTFESLMVGFEPNNSRCTKSLQDVPIEIDEKDIYFGSGYKVKWKHVMSVEILEEEEEETYKNDSRNMENVGFILKSQHFDKKHGYHDDITAPSSTIQQVFMAQGPIQEHRAKTITWNQFRTVLMYHWEKLEKKRLRKKQREQEELDRERQQQRLGRTLPTNRKRNATYSKRPHDFLKKNKTNILHNATITSKWSDDEEEEQQHDEVNDDNDVDDHASDDDDDDDEIINRVLHKKTRREEVLKNLEEEDKLWKQQVNNEVSVMNNEQDDEDNDQEFDGASSIKNDEDKDIAGDVDFAPSDNENHSKNDDDTVDENEEEKEKKLKSNTVTPKNENEINKTKNPRPRKKNRLRIQDDSDDEDNTLFDGPNLTTPATQRVVSPSTITASIIKTRRRKVIEDDDDDDSDRMNDIDEVNKSYKDEEKTGKKKITNFFGIQSGKVPDNTKHGLTAPIKSETSDIPSTQSNDDTIEDHYKVVDTSNDDAKTTMTKADNDSAVKDNVNNKRKKADIAQSFFAPRKQKPTTFVQSTPKRKKSRLDESGKDSTTRMVDEGVRTPPSNHHTDIIHFNPEELKPKSKVKISPGFSRTFNIVRRSANKSIDEEDPIEEVDSSQSPLQSHTRGIPLQPRKRLKIYGRNNRHKTTQISSSMEALDMADAHAYRNQSPAITKSRPRLSQYSSGRQFKHQNFSPPRTPVKQLQFDSNEDNTVVSEPLKWRGLNNDGNTCYVNSSVQALFSIKDFMKSISALRDGHELVSSLTELWNNLNTSNQFSSASARKLKKVIDSLTDSFAGYEQRDAHEFLGDIIDRIHEELATQNDSTTESKNDTKMDPTDNFFRMDVQVCLTCKSCGYSRTKEEMYRNLSIDIVAPETYSVDPTMIKHSVKSCLASFFRPEDREVKCEKCTDGQFATQTMKILSKPKALLLHLKRFILVETIADNENRPGNSPQMQIAFQKNESPVELNTTLSLDGFLAKPTTDMDDCNEYSLKSIVHHVGTTADSGHYTADASRTDQDSGKETWISFDDGIVIETSLDRLVRSQRKQKTAYMLLYSIDKRSPAGTFRS